jgi:large subunit ribosomal protein L3
MFANGERVDVIGESRGKGFQGVVRRHHFGGGAATHGSMFHRAPGSIGASSFPSRVIKGMRAAGRMGGGRVTVRNLKVLRVDADNHLLIVEGASLVRRPVRARAQSDPRRSVSRSRRWRSQRKERNSSL